MPASRDEVGNITYMGAVPRVVSGSVLFSSISSRFDHICGIATTGDAYCWGYDAQGEAGATQLGVYFVPAPTKVSGISVATISAGRFVTCAVSTTGDGYCWGYSLFGKLGTGVPQDTIPVKRTAAGGLVAGNIKWASIDAGGDGSTCGLSVSGKAYCWGMNERGETGIDPATSAVPRCVGGGFTSAGGCDLVPHPITSGVSFLEVSIGDKHACGRTDARFIMCWGDNAFGELGTSGGDTWTPVPVLLPASALTSVSSASAGLH